MPDDAASEAALWRATVEDLYVRHGALVLRTCRAILRDHHAAEDATQEIFAKLCSHGAPAEVRDPRRWLLEVTRNHCIDRLRAAARRATAGIDGDRAAAAEDAEARSLAREHLRWLLSLLTPGQRDVVVRQAVLDEPLGTVASRLGLSYGAAAQLLYRARLVLAKAGGAGDAALVLAGGRITALGRRLQSLVLRFSAGGRLQPGRTPLDAALALPVAALLVTLLARGAAAPPAGAVPSPPAATLAVSDSSAVRIAAPAHGSGSVPVPVQGPTVARTAPAPPPPPPVQRPGVKGGVTNLQQLEQPHCLASVGVPECFSGQAAPARISLGAPLPLP